MANQEQLRILKRGVKVRNRDVHIDLTGANLRGTSLISIDELIKSLKPAIINLP